MPSWMKFTPLNREFLVPTADPAGTLEGIDCEKAHRLIPHPLHPLHPLLMGAPLPLFSSPLKLPLSLPLPLPLSQTLFLIIIIIIHHYP